MASNAKTTRREQQTDLLAFTAALRTRIEAEVDGFDPDLQAKRLDKADTGQNASTRTSGKPSRQRRALRRRYD